MGQASTARRRRPGSPRPGPGRHRARLPDRGRGTGARMTELDAEDAKLVVLARGAMGRAEAPSGAAVRDLDGRTYAGAPLALAALQLTALQAAVAAAVSSGATGLEAAVLGGG